MIYLLGIVPSSILSLSGLVLFFKLRLKNDPYMKVARNITLALIGLSLLQVACSLPSFDAKLSVTLASIFVSFFVTWALVYVGLTLSMRHSHAYWLSDNDTQSRKRIFRIALSAAVAATIGSLTLFSITKPNLGAAAKLLQQQGGTVVSTAIWIVAVAISEEFTYRGTFQNILRHWIGDSSRARWTVIGVSAFVWTVAHAGSLSPDWVKFLQIYPIGIFLGWQFRQHGLLACITTHVVFNILTSLSWPLIPGWPPE